MTPDLTVTKAFGPYRIGEKITDPAEVEKVLAGRGRLNVVKTLAAAKPVEIAAPQSASAPIPPKAEKPAAKA